MSLPWSTTVWRQSKAKGSVLLLLLAIADYADTEGRAFPKVATLAKRLRLQRRQVLHLIGEAEKLGELTRTSGRGPGRHNSYQLHINKGAADDTQEKLHSRAARVQRSAQEGAVRDAPDPKRLWNSHREQEVQPPSDELRAEMRRTRKLMEEQGIVPRRMAA